MKKEKCGNFKESFLKVNKNVKQELKAAGSILGFISLPDDIFIFTISVK